MIKTTEYRLGELCKRFSSGKGISSDLINDTGLYPVIGGNGLRGYTDTYNFNGECAVIGRQGAYCGNVLYFSGKGYMTEHAVVTEPKSDHNAKYLSYKLGRMQLGRFSGQAAQPGLSVTKLARLRIEMPPKWYQDKVASIISMYDDLIEVNNKRIKILEQMVDNLYKEWFIRLRFPGYENVELEGGVLKNWKTKPISAWMIENFNGGWGEEDNTTNTPFLAHVIRGTDIEDIKQSRYCEIPCRFHKQKDIKTKQLKENDIILELSNGNIDNIGRTLFVDKELLDHYDQVMCASFCKTLRFVNKQIAFFVWKHIEYMQNSGLMSFYKNTGANGINNFNFKRFLRMPISIPNDYTHIETLMKYNKQIIKLREMNYVLMQQRDLLLPRLISGKLEV